MIESIEKLRTSARNMAKGSNLANHEECNLLLIIADEIEAEIAERYMLKDEAKLDKTAVQEYNITVQVAAGQTIEYNTELRHRRGAATSMSVAFRLE